MPKLHIHLNDIDDLDEIDDWQALVGASTLATRPDARSADERRRGERRFGGAEALDRKRADRRKHVSRPSKRA